MASLTEQLEQWLKERPKWMQDAARRIVANGSLTDLDFKELFAICVAESSDPSTAFAGLPSGALNIEDVTNPLRLDSISSVQGINALNPQKPLAFGDKPLCIVYGHNGAGKSGYVRLIKHACGVKQPGALLPDVFKGGSQAQAATFAFTENTQNNSSAWAGRPLSALRGVDIYDTACGFVYLNSENEVTFEPWLLRLFTHLTDACGTLSQNIQAQINGKVSKKPIFPHELFSTSGQTWYDSITEKTSTVEVEKVTKWTATDDKVLAEIAKRLAETNPTAKVATLNRQKQSLVGLLTVLKKLHKEFSPTAISNFLRLKADAQKKRKAADEDAKKVFENAPLAGVGSESWRLLWEAARTYSTEDAYPDIEFPNVSADARCVLCQQTLGEESRKRHHSFEMFVKGELQKVARAAEKLFKTTENAFSEIPTPDSFDLRMDAAGILNGRERMIVSQFITAITKRKNTCLTSLKISQIPELPDRVSLVGLVNVARQKAEQARMYERDAKKQNRPQLEKSRKEMSARKWLNQQRKAIDAEISRLVAIKKLETANRLTNTAALSKKKSVLADDLITKAYVNRFKNELTLLKAGHLPVELRKTRADVGHVYHQIFLKNIRTSGLKTTDILSEGEFRIISLAAFLADSEGRGAKTPFVFDDPISSLDQSYEEATSQRLISLCKSRQVIVFTHRLSLLGLLEKYADKEKVPTTVVCLSRSRTGAIADLPIYLKKTKPAANTLLGERLKAAKKAFEVGDAAYEIEAKALCRDIRVLVENIVEADLLSGVVRRYNPEVQTKGKLEHLAKITDEDCKFVDDMMTAYSRHEHSQPDEAPVQLPTPDEIEVDLKRILKFIETVQKRKE